MEISLLMNVLNQGEEQIRELVAQLDQPYPSEACKHLASQAQAALATAISTVKLLDQPNKTFESPLLDSESLQSKNSVKAFTEQERKEAFKKRKAISTWKKQVRVCSGSSAMADGYSWRKYGQKEILGSKFPRAYYRCTHRDTDGCLATKQVQRSDEDSSLFEISLRGDHTCTTRDRRRIPEPTPVGHITSPETEGLMIVSGDLQPSSAFSFPSICGLGNDIGGTNLCWPGSEMAEILSGATSMTSEFLMGSSDFGLGEFDFDAEFLLDFS